MVDEKQDDLNSAVQKSIRLNSECGQTESKSWPNLGIEDVDFGFGWRKIGEAGTQTIDNLLDELEKKASDLKKQSCESCVLASRLMSDGRIYCQSFDRHIVKSFRCNQYAKKIGSKK